MSSRLDIKKVNRYDTDWDASTIFSGYSIRAILAGTTDLVTRITERSRLAKRLRREIGDEDVDWMIQEHPRTGEVELYLKNSGPLIMWKLQDHESFSKLFDRVEQHTDDPNEISEDQP
jgi:hypothetical protein